MKNSSTRFLNIFPGVVFYLTITALVPAHASRHYPKDDFLSLSLEQLAQIKISSVSKQDEALTEAAASIYVITRDHIRNAGVTSIPEALRLAPNLQVARINASQYAITARGFNATVSNKLLVLIDGRTIYTPLFSGVFWNQQDVLLEDIERIEVISGPGATLWGANAVNGVINIITRSAEDTPGLLATAYGGNFERGATVRYGGSFGDTGHYRAYAKGMEIGHTQLEDGTQRREYTASADGFERGQAGFRADWGDATDRFTVQGDIFEGETADRGVLSEGLPSEFVIGAIEVSGNNLLARWNHQFDSGSNFRLQAYWDHTTRKDTVLFQPTADIYDIEFQHTIPLANHKVIWGSGYRHAQDEVEPGFFATFVPDSRELNWENLFVQDEIRLRDDLTATLGLRLETNDYTGTEYLPNARLAWKFSSENLLWTAISRAVRAPSRFDREVFFPAPPNSFVVGGPNFESEVANVFELGYRSLSSDHMFYSVTAFYHDWDKLRSGSAIPTEIENKIQGSAYGLEAWANYQVNANWRLSAGGTTLKKDLELKPDSTDPVGTENDTLHNDPEYQLVVRSLLEISDKTVINLSLRHVAELPHPKVPSYTVLDAHFGWQVQDNLRLSLTVQNLANADYREFEQVTNGSEFERSAFVRVVWTN